MPRGASSEGARSQESEENPSFINPYLYFARLHQNVPPLREGPCRIFLREPHSTGQG